MLILFLEAFSTWKQFDDFYYFFDMLILWEEYNMKNILLPVILEMRNILSPFSGYSTHLQSH